MDTEWENRLTADELTRKTSGQIDTGKANFEMPTGRRADMFTAWTSGILIGSFLGLVWYFGVAYGFADTPWMAVLLGAAIALAVKKGTRGSGSVELMVSSLLYLIIGLVVLSCLTYFSTNIQRNGFSYERFESHLNFWYFKPHISKLAYLAGLATVFALTWRSKQVKR